MQKQKWEEEYSTLQNLPSSRTKYPSKALKGFLDNYTGNRDSALDVGSGKARNSIYLAQQGFKKVVGIEFVDSVVEQSRRLVEDLGLESTVSFVVGSVGEKMPFEVQRFDVIVDMMVLHLLNKDERDVYCKEVKRLLKPKGSFVFHTIYADSPAAIDLVKKHPGSEPNSYVIPETGMIEKAFTKNELKEMFAPLELADITEVMSFTPAFGDVFKKVYLTGKFIN